MKVKQKVGTSWTIKKLLMIILKTSRRPWHPSWNRHYFCLYHVPACQLSYRFNPAWGCRKLCINTLVEVFSHGWCHLWICRHPYSCHVGLMCRKTWCDKGALVTCRPSARPWSWGKWKSKMTTMRRRSYVRVAAWLWGWRRRVARPSAGFESPQKCHLCRCRSRQVRRMWRLWWSWQDSGRRFGCVLRIWAKVWRWTWQRWARRQLSFPAREVWRAGRPGECCWFSCGTQAWWMMWTPLMVPHPPGDPSPLPAGQIV